MGSHADNEKENAGSKRPPDSGKLAHIAHTVYRLWAISTCSIYS